MCLGGCSWVADDPGPTPAQVKRAPPRDWVTEIRAAASTAPSEVEVTPLFDPAVADLRAKAQAAEHARNFAEAAAQLEQASAFRDDDPDLLQWRAEIELQRRKWRAAATFSQQSLEIGPRIGTLCVRSWLTIEAVRTELGDAAGARSARAQLKSCAVPALIRM